MFHGLMGRAVLAQADAVVGVDPDGTEPHQRREPDRRAHVIGEDQEGGAVGDEAAMIGHAVDDGPHPVLAHAEVHVAAAEAPDTPDHSLSALLRPGGRLEVTLPLEPAERGGVEVR